MVTFARAFGLLLALAASRSASAAEPPGRPNIVLLIADDMGDTDCPAFGNPAVKAPHLTRLAADGMRFDRAFVTSSSCSPSRCSLISGRYPHSHGAPQLHQPLPEGQPNFVAELKAAGYWTALAGKTHLGADALKAFDEVKQGGGASGCAQWLPTVKGRPRDKPSFLWLAAIDPHRPYPGHAIPEPHDPAKVAVPPFLPDTPEVRRDFALYYDEIGRLDSYVGLVLAELAAQGAAENTLVLFLSDNGRPFPRCKTTLYDSGIRTPMVVRWPAKVKPGTATASLVSAVDVGPTFLEAAGVPAPAAMQGKAFGAVLADPKASVRDRAFAEKNWHDFDDRARAVRTAGWKYVRNAYADVPLTPPADAVRSPTFQAMVGLEAAGRLPSSQRACFALPRPAEELYDLTADPNELKDLSSDPAHEDKLKELRAALDAWAKETDDRAPRGRTPDGYDRKTGEPLRK